MGCIMAELYTFRPLFPGTSQSDQIYKVCSVLGTPDAETWDDGIKLANQSGISFPRFAKTYLGSLIKQASPEGINLIQVPTPTHAPSPFSPLHHPALCQLRRRYETVDDVLPAFLRAN